MCLTRLFFSTNQCRLIVDQMSSTRCQTINWTVWSVAVAFVIALVVRPAYAVEVLLLRGLTAFVVIGHLHYGICVVRQLCDHFDIYCFFIGKRNKQAKL